MGSRQPGRLGAHGEAVRRRILESLLESPGRDLREMAVVLAISRGQLRYHLDILRRRGLATRTLVAGQWHYFAAGQDAIAHRGALYLKKDDKVRDLAQLVRAEMGAVPARDAVRWLMDEHSLTRSGAWGVLRRAIRAGVVIRGGSGQLVTLHARAAPALSDMQGR